MKWLLSSFPLLSWLGFSSGGKSCGASERDDQIKKGQAIYFNDIEYRCEKIEAQRGEKGGSR